MLRSFFTLFLLLPLLSFAQEKVKVFFLGGQSNMEGFGYNKDLPDSLTEFNNVYIFHGNTAGDGADGGKGIWEALKPGHGRDFSSTEKKNKLSDRFGLELSFAAKMQQLYPGEKIALIKYAKGGSSIDTLGAPTQGTWDPDFRGSTNQYDHFLSTTNNAFFDTDIDGDGKAEILVPSGILWMQGESDAHTREIASRYYTHLTRLMDLIRAAFRVDDLPVVIGKISDSWHPRYNGKVWKYGELVQDGQEEFVRNDERAAIVRQTRYYKYSDPWHYTSIDYVDMGIRFALEMDVLMKKQ